MDRGTLLSTTVHAAAFGWLVFGGVFRSEPLPMSVQEVSVISAEQFAALQIPSLPSDAPATATEVALPMPEPVDAPPETETPEPEPELAIAAPPSLSEPSPATAPPVPEISENPKPFDADRVEREAAPDPEPDRAEADEVQEAVEDAPSETPLPEDAQEATAPDAATTEIVTEADTPSAAPTTSLRPPSARPARSAADPIASAVAAAVAETSAPLGPPLTGGEIDGMKVAVERCWNINALSTEAQETIVVVYVAMNRDGTPQANSVRMLSHSNGGRAAAQRAFGAARRAILRCGARGFPLPPEKYAQWREIEMTFNPEGLFWQ